MYKIIGADGRHYGPVDADQIKRWFAENRVNGQTRAQPEGATDWQPLSAFPEFGGDFAAIQPPPTLAPPPLSAPYGQYLANRASNKIAAGVCGILLGSLGIHKFILGYTGPGLILLLATVLTCGIAGVVTGLIGFIEGIIYLTKPDDEFVRTYVDGRKEWF
jgi:TM2 domain-containing membrane protein YozV